MKRIYLDNAATTPLLPEVIEVMQNSLMNVYGNPSSIHNEGRIAKNTIESARKVIAQAMGASIGEIYFTSGGTESNNMALKCAVRDLNVRRIITTRIEHSCIKKTIAHLQKHTNIEIEYLDNDHEGAIDLAQLESFLASSNQYKTLVSIMHANNETGTLADIDAIGKLCKGYEALFHTDTVQTVAHLPFDLSKINIDFLSASAHKFHGPKGVGFLYIKSDHLIEPFIDGGGQEKNLRAGTENISSIVGMAKAMELAVANMATHTDYILKLKQYFMQRLLEEFEDIEFNGPTDDRSLFTVLNVMFPVHPKNEMLLINLDIEGISASGGSACNSGAEIGSLVVKTLKKDNPGRPVRFSFSHLNNFDEIDVVVNKLVKIFEPIPV